MMGVPTRTQLGEGGLPMKIRLEIVNSATTGFGRQWEKIVQSETVLNCFLETKKHRRVAEKLNSKSSWFKKTGNKKMRTLAGKKIGTIAYKKTNCKVERVMFIPFTPFSSLKKEMNRVEELVNGNRLTEKVRFVEGSRPSIRDIIYKKSS